ncbi:MAG TPA: hypothetical protein VJX31_10170 [Casimicrobiaceae bacterium]|nr:hypothetical protein [Casimicrobiaceae bacterium]
MGAIRINLARATVRHGNSVEKELRMKRLTIGVLGIAFVALAGCETLNGPQAVADADEQRGECKVVGLTSATQIMRSENPRDVDRGDIRQAEGSLEAGRLGLAEPKGLRKPGAPHDSHIERLSRNC